MSKKSDVISGAGFTASFWVALDKKRQSIGVSDEAFHEALKDDSPIFFRIVEHIMEITAKRVEIPVKLDYTEPLETKVVGLVNFSGDRLLFTDKNFGKVVGTGRKETKAVLVNFGTDRAYGIEEHLDRMGLRPGVAKELADLSKSNPGSKLAAYFPIVARGDNYANPVGLNAVLHCAALEALNNNPEQHQLFPYPVCDGNGCGSTWYLAFPKEPGWGLPQKHYIFSKKTSAPGAKPVCWKQLGIITAPSLMDARAKIDLNCIGFRLDAPVPFADFSDGTSLYNLEEMPAWNGTLDKDDHLITVQTPAEE